MIDTMEAAKTDFPTEFFTGFCVRETIEETGTGVNAPPRQDTDHVSSES
ncbi:MAG TPA: hypothetical protein VLL97_12750 [Acidobacteriota bacterium]|nr:hypothetical protein [Acidobacteriota bacterium]